jgi:hypothetical protein
VSSIRLLLCGCLLASALGPASAATWNPDPSLGNVDQHRRLYEIARTFGDTNFDPDANLVGAHSKKPPNKKQHSTRESAYYAYGLLLTGDPADRARAQAILKRVVTLQDTNPKSPTYGVFNWVAEDRPQDYNSGAFVGLTLADVVDLDRRKPSLDPDVRSQVENSTRLAVEEVMRRNINAGYTNIALLSTALVAAGEKLWSLPGAGAWAQTKLDTVMALADDGEFAEYLSPTYTGVALQGAYMARKFSFSDAFAAKADATIDHLWKQVAASYHPPTYQLGGPYLRAYGDNMLDYCALLKYFIYLGVDGAYPIPDTQFEHDWDMGSLFAIADLPIPARPEFKAPHVPWREWTAVGSPGGNADADNSLVRHLCQYREGNFILGTVAYQDEWKQKRNLVAFWRNDGPPPDGMRVGLCIDESNEFQAIGGFPGEKLHFCSQQVKGAALVGIVAAAGSVPKVGTSTLVFDDGAMVPETKDASSLAIHDGTMTVYLYPVSTGNPRFVNEPDAAHHLTRVLRPWSSADVVGSLRVLSYLIVFRPASQPAPVISGLALKADENGASASATVDGVELSVPLKNQ